MHCAGGETARETAANFHEVYTQETYKQEMQDLKELLRSERVEVSRLKGEVARLESNKATKALKLQ